MTRIGYTADNKHSENRIKACLAACAGIPTEQLEAGCVEKLIEAATRLHYDDIKAALAPFQKGEG